MKYSLTEVMQRKCQAMAAVNYFVSKNTLHINCSFTASMAEISLFFDTEEEMMEVEKECQAFMIDGSSFKSYHHEASSSCAEYYCITLEWL